VRNFSGRGCRPARHRRERAAFHSGAWRGFLAGTLGPDLVPDELLDDAARRLARRFAHPRVGLGGETVWLRSELDGLFGGAVE